MTSDRDREMAQRLWDQRPLQNGIDRIAAALAQARAEEREAWWPPHKCSMTISHNSHKDVYETVEQYEGEAPNWASDEDRAQAIATNELWELQWYPDTPVGFIRIYAATYDNLRAAAIRARGEEK